MTQPPAPTPTPFPTSIVFDQQSYSSTIPASGNRIIQTRARLRDQNNNEIIGLHPTYTTTHAGLTIDTFGVVTIPSHTAPGTAVIHARHGNLTATVNLQLRRLEGPSNLWGINITSSTVRLQWIRPANDTGAIYSIHRNTDTNLTSPLWSGIGGSHILEGLAPNTEHRLLVASRDSHGNILGRSNTITFTTLARANIDIYAPASLNHSSVYTGIAENAALPFRRTFDMEVFINFSRVTQGMPRVASCPCNNQNCDLRNFLDAMNVAWFFRENVQRRSPNAQRTLIFNEPIYIGNCENELAGYVDLPNFREALVSSRTPTLFIPEVGWKTFLPVRTAQHEWSHSFGITWDPYHYHEGHPRSCPGDCIMMLHYVDEPFPFSNIWCRRCSDIIQGNRGRFS